MPLCYVFYMWNKQTYFNALLFMNLCLYPFMLHMRDKLNATMLCFLYVEQTNVFQCIVIHESLFVSFHVAA